MNYIVITDIFGNKISKNRDANIRLPFLLIHSTQPYLLLNKLDDHIWSIKWELMSHILYINSVDPEQFAPLGDIWLSSKILPKQMSILLVNADKVISTFPISFIKLDSNNTTFIWKPVSPPGYQELGLIASPHKPPLQSMKVINKKYVIPYKTTTHILNTTRTTNMNEFNLLSHLEIDKYTINKTMFLTNPSLITIALKTSGKYIAADDQGEIVLDERKQPINYTVKGELKIDDKCISVNNNKIKLEQCNDSLKQKWYPYLDKYISTENNSCLTNQEGTLHTSECNSSNNSQKWFSHDYCPSENTEWKTIQGDNVILIESDVPWYVLKRNTIPFKHDKNDINHLNEVSYRNNADFKSQFKMNMCRPDLGYGYSYAQRHNNVMKQIEEFDAKKIDFNVIACLLILLIFLLLAIRSHMNKI